MFARFPLEAGRPHLRVVRLADWWPAAFVGLLALLGAAPDTSATTLSGLF